MNFGLLNISSNENINLKYMIMEAKILSIINEIRAAKEMAPVETISVETKLREDLNLTSFDLAELTVKIEDEFDIDIFEDGLVSTVGEIFAKLQA